MAGLGVATKYVILNDLNLSATIARKEQTINFEIIYDNNDEDDLNVVMTLATIMTLRTMMMKTSTKMTSTMMTSTEMITVIFDQSKNGRELELGKIQLVH